jgi:predicted enzyme related to lactoylglutathione lyase
MSLRVGCVTIDSKDCRRLAQFWAAALGWRVVSDTEEGVYLVPQETAGRDSAVPGLLLFPCADQKKVKNRVHLDLRPDDQAAEIERLEALGATRAVIGQTGAEPWVVMADPEGNEFCVLAAR